MAGMAGVGDVVSDEHKPGFKKQNQEFIGTVCPYCLDGVIADGMCRC